MKLLKKSTCIVVIVARTLTVRSVRLTFSFLDASPLELFRQFLMSIRTATFLIVLGALPLVAFAESAPYQYSQQGIMSCQGGGSAQSIGSQSATAGIYVPVADATVELNTGILVYKECILRQIVKKMGESATASFTGQMVQAVNTGRGGQPQFIVNRPMERLLVRDKGKIGGIQAAQSAVNPALRNNVVNVDARSYLASTQKPNSILTCPFQGDLDAFTRMQPNSFSFERLADAGHPTCYALGLSYRFSERTGAVAAQEVQDQADEWAAGNDYYARKDAQGNVVTPAIVVQQSFQEVIGTGFRQLENANDVGQIVGALFAGIMNQVTSNSQGLSGLNQSFNGQPSYLDQVISQSRNGLIGAVVNAALQILNAARNVEMAYLQAINTILQTLAGTSAQLKDTENQCWNLIIPRVMTYASSTGATIVVATSTQFSQPIITAQITPLQAPTLANASTSRAALARIDGLIAAVTNSTDPAAQQAALAALDVLVATGGIHTAQDLTVVRTQQQSVTDAMTALVQNTITTWSENTDPNIGWCNIGNDAAIQMWAQRWTH